MSPTTYHFLHIVGALCLFVSIGGLLAGSNGPRKLISALHGIGMLVLLVAGVGYLHKSGLGFPSWAIAKIVLWLGMGILPLAVKKGWFKASVGVTFGLLLGAVAAYLGYFKPF